MPFWLGNSYHQVAFTWLHGVPVINIEVGTLMLVGVRQS